MARKRINKSVVIGLALFGFAGMIGLSIVMLLQLQQRDPIHFVELARSYEAQEQWQQAAVFYAKASERSGDATHLVSSGDMLREDGDVNGAVRSWSQALLLRPDLVSAHMRRLELLLEYARLDPRVPNWLQVQSAAETLLKADAEKTPAQIALGHYGQGLALVILEGQEEDNAAKGLAALEEAVRLAPENVDFSRDLASYFVREKRAEDAERLLVSLLDRHPSSGADASKSRLVYAQHLAGLPERREDAERYFKESIALADSSRSGIDAKLGYALFLAQKWAAALTDPALRNTAQALFDDAESTLRSCIAADVDAFDPYLQLASLYRMAARHADVIAVCDQRLALPFPRKGLEAIRHKVHWFGLMVLASEASVGEALAARTAGDAASEQRWLDKAEQYVTDAKAEFPSHPRAMSQSGRVKLAKGLDRDALDDLRKADEAYRSYNAVDWENKMILARVHLSLNEPGAAKTVLEEVVEQAGARRANDTNFWTLFAQVLVQTNDLDRALAVADQVLVIDRGHVDARRVKAAVLERLGKTDQAAKIVEELSGSSTVRTILDARKLAQDGQMDAAIGALREAWEKNPSDARLAGTLINELLSQGRTDEAAAVVQRAMAAAPENAQLKRLAVLTRKDLSPDARNRAMLETIQAEKDAYKRSLDLIDFHSRTGDSAAALQWIDEAQRHLLAKDTPLAQGATAAHHRALITTKLRIASELKNDRALDEARDAAAKYNVDGAGGKSILGLYHMYRNETDLAIRALREAVELQPTDARCLAHLGHCLQTVGNAEDARTYLERSLRINPNEALAHKAMAALSQRLGDKAGYEKELALCQKLIPNDPWVQAELQARKEQADPVAAIARREARLAEHPSDLENLWRLAGLCEGLGEQAKADGYYDRVLALRPDDQETVISVSRYYRRTGRPERALAVVTRYADSRADAEQKAGALIVVAGHHLHQDRADLVESTLLAAADIAQSPEVCQSLAEFYLRTANRPDKALPWFDKAVQSATDAKSPDLPRILATRIACVLHRGVQDVDAARRYIDEFRRRYPDDTRGLFWESELHARAGRIDKAIEALSTYLQRKPDETFVLFQRAQYQLAMGRTALAMEDLEEIKRKDPSGLDLTPRLLLAHLHARVGREDLSIRELEALVQDAPDSTRAHEELVRAYNRKLRFDEAERICTAQINRGPSPEPKWLFLRASTYLERGEHDRALADAQRGAELASFDAGALTAVLDLYIRLSRYAEALDYYGRYSSVAKPAATLVSRYARLLAKTDRKTDAVRQFRIAMDLAAAEGVDVGRAVIEDLAAAFPANEAIPLFEGPVDDPRMARANRRILIRLNRLAGRVDQATALLTQEIASAADDRERARLFHEQGEMYQVAGKAPEAKLAYEESLRYDGANWITLNNLAYLLSDKLGENLAARAYAQRAVALADTPDTLDTLGWIYVGLGEFTPAIAELSRAFRLDPDQTLLAYHLGEAYRRNSQFLEAAEVLRRGQELARAAKDDALTAQLNKSMSKTEARDSTK